MALVYIHADESCLGNTRARPTPGGAGGLVEVWRGEAWERRDFWVSEPATTNNRMALCSATVPLLALRRPCRVVFVSDSQYLVNGMTSWVHAWVRQGWKRKTGVVENAELWQDLVRAAARHAIDWRWVRGHAGHAQNEYANHLATRAAREQNASGGLVPSGFVEWLESEREKGRYLDFFEFSPPPSDPFEAASEPGGV